VAASWGDVSLGDGGEQIVCCLAGAVEGHGVVGGAQHGVTDVIGRKPASETLSPELPVIRRSRDPLGNVPVRDQRYSQQRRAAWAHSDQTTRSDSKTGSR
jgi:hypothetical protein